MSKKSQQQYRNSSVYSVYAATEATMELGVWLTTIDGINCRLSVEDGCFHTDSEDMESICISQES